MPRAVPTPGGGIFLGNTLAFGRDVLGHATRWAEELGDVVQIRVPGLELYQVTHPSLIETLLSGHHRDLRKDWFTRSLSEILGQGLVVAEGERWRAQRRVLQPAFHPRHLPSYAEVMARSAEQLAREILREPVRDVFADTMRLTARVVSSALFSHDVAEDTETLRRAMAVYTDHFGGIFGTRLRLPLAVPTPSALRVRFAFMEVDALVERLIDARKGAPQAADDLLSSLLNARDSDGKPLTARQVRDEIVTMLLAGHETSALALTYALDLLARHPEVTKKVQVELDTVLQGRLPSHDDLVRLPYTNAVVAETLRLYPPVWTLGRELLTDVPVGDHVLPRGATVMLPPWVVQRDRRWFPEPLRFAPERFLNGCMKSLPRYAYFPFGAGTRMCLGTNFALIEAVLVLSTLLSRLDIADAPSRPLRLFASATLRPVDPVTLRFAPRASRRAVVSLAQSASAPETFVRENV